MVLVKMKNKEKCLITTDSLITPPHEYAALELLQVGGEECC